MATKALIEEWENHDDDFTKPLKKFPKDEILLNIVYDMNTVYNWRMRGPNFDEKKTCFQNGLRRCHDIKILDDIGFDSNLYDHDVKAHPNIPRLRGIYTHKDDDTLVAIQTRTGGENLWEYDEVYVMYNDWEKQFSEKPETTGYPNNNDLRKNSNYLWDEGDTCGDDYHIFYFTRPCQKYLSVFD